MIKILKVIFINYFLLASLFVLSNENIESFSKLPDIYDVKISPNGEMIGFHRKVNDELILSIINLKTKELIYNHRFVKKGEIGAF